MTRTLIALAASLACFSALAATGPSTTTTPYLVPTAAGVELTSILSVGDAADNGYKMVGIPDGLGVVDNHDGSFTLFMNHELGNTLGSVRAHGSTGAFVSQWRIRASDLKVLEGRDLIQSPADVMMFDGSGWVPGTTAFNRLCSANLAPKSAFYNPATGKGYKGAIFMNGEEAGAEGRAFAWVDAKGKLPAQVWQLPDLGRASWENQVANPMAQDKTIVVGTDDTSTNGQVYVYVGDKQSSGTAIERAGLVGGKLYAVKANGNQSEDASDLPFGAGADGRFTLVDVTASARGTGAALNTATVNAGATNFMRPEDAAWNPRDPQALFVATTASMTSRSRLWELRFDDLSQPELGGTIRVAGDGNQGFKMADNLTVDQRSGHVIFQEDVGNDARLGKVWGLNPATGALVELAAHDADRFLSGGAHFLTQDEESSGIIDISDVLKKAGYDTRTDRYYLLVTQAHYAISGELVEGGQLQLMKVPGTLVK